MGSSHSIRRCVSEVPGPQASSFASPTASAASSSPSRAAGPHHPKRRPNASNTPQVVVVPGFYGFPKAMTGPDLLLQLLRACVRVCVLSPGPLHATFCSICMHVLRTSGLVPEWWISWPIAIHPPPFHGPHHGATHSRPSSSSSSSSSQNQSQNAGVGGLVSRTEQAWEGPLCHFTK